MNQDTSISNSILVENTNQLTSIATGSNGCEVIRSIPVTYDTISPTIGVQDDTLTCIKPIVTLQNITQNDRYLYEWTSSSGVTISDVSVVDLENPDMVELLIRDTINNCIAQVAAEVLIDTISPILSLTYIDSLTCTNPTFEASTMGSSQGLLSWSGPNIDGLSTEEVSIINAGTYEVSLTGDNGCVSQGSFQVLEDNDNPNVDIQDNFNLTCDDPSRVLIPTVIEDDLTLSWILGGRTVVSDSLEINTSGDIVLLAETSNGCDTTILISVTYDTLVPVAQILTSDTTDCSGEPILIISEDVSGSDLTHTWRLDGIEQGNTSGSISIASSGSVVYSILNNANGCESIDSITVRISSDPFRGIDYSINNETCLGANDGLIGMIAAEGGDGQVSVSIDNRVISGDMASLTVGAHSLIVQDELGCIFREDIEVLPGVDFDVILPERLQVFRDESVLIIPQYEGASPLSVEWMTSDGSFFNIDSLSYIPTVDQVIQLIAISPEGCIVSETMSIDVVTDFSRIQLYMPNIMNLSSQNENHQILMQLPDDVLSMDSFIIYDRWGQKILDFGSEIRRDPFVLWDGTFDGAQIESGVYVYVYQITTSEENRQKKVTGDLTVIR